LPGERSLGISEACCGETREAGRDARAEDWMVMKAEEVEALAGRVKGPMKEAEASRMIVSPGAAASRAF
jgi:hypothetical protein